MKNKITILIAFILAFSSCSKQPSSVPFWNEEKKFQFQQTSYMHVDGNKVEIISLGDWSEQHPNETMVKIFAGTIGGQQSFTDTTSVANFLYITDSVYTSGIYTADAISITNASVAESISVNITGAIQSTGTNISYDFRKIASLNYHGKTFLPITGHDYFIARENEIGQALNLLITKDKNCEFAGCVNGVSTTIQWYYNGSEVSIIANGGTTMIRGTVIGSRFSTPMLLTSTGELYIIQFYTLSSDSNQQACTCTMNFKLYKVRNQKSTITKPAFELVIGNC